MGFCGSIFPEIKIVKLTLSSSATFGLIYVFLLFTLFREARNTTLNTIQLFMSVKIVRKNVRLLRPLAKYYGYNASNVTVRSTKRASVLSPLISSEINLAVTVPIRLYASFVMKKIHPKILVTTKTKTKILTGHSVTTASTGFVSSVLVVVSISQ